MENKTQLKEMRASLKLLGYKIKTAKSSSYISLDFFDLEGNRFPSIFTKDSLQKWETLINELKKYKHEGKSLVYYNDDKCLF